MAPIRPRPVLVCLVRDLSGHAKRHMLHHLTPELPSKFVHVDSTANEGVDMAAIQKVLSAGQSAVSGVCEVDVGLTRAQRECTPVAPLPPGGRGRDRGAGPLSGGDPGAGVHGEGPPVGPTRWWWRRR